MCDLRATAADTRRRCLFGAAKIWRVPVIGAGDNAEVLPLR
ncbi:MAG TPA: hypothetical protein VIL85_03255 [Thermomicrobiales bacterium]